MEIRWNNIIALLLLIFAFVILMRGWDEIGQFFSGMGDLGPRHSQEEQIMGLIAFGLVGVLIVAVVKILTQGKE